jgi:hypothetical protein
MFKKKKGELRPHVTVDIGEFKDKVNGVEVKRRAYITLFKDELAATGYAETKLADYKEVKITRGKLAGRTIAVPINDNPATGRHFQLLFKKTGGVTTKPGKNKRKVINYERVQVYYPGWMSTFQIGEAIEKMKKKPVKFITDGRTTVSVTTSKGRRA